VRKRVVIFGSSGSVGMQALDVIREHLDLFEVVGLALHSNTEALEQQIAEFCPKRVCVFCENSALRVKGLGAQVVSGRQGLVDLAHLEADICLFAMSGSMGLEACLEAIKRGRRIALANKEILVMAGDLVMASAKKFGAQILPVDSEHSALFQCLVGESPDSVDSLILTASGGPFRTHSLEELKGVTASQALCHPTWSMGPKISIDSSTMMNKGLEVIEAKHLFNIGPERIKVVIHPQSFVHSMVVFQDGSIKAQMGEPSMKDPIRYALSYPDRLKVKAPFAFKQSFMLDFHQPCTKRFLPLALAFEALKLANSAPCFLSAVNDVLVERFLRGEISWLCIGQKAQELMLAHSASICSSLEEVQAVHEMGQKLATNV
jgi:1-deoxy-D-xylulose-5-phosphate reductoisomerase